MTFSITINGDTLAEIATHARDLSDRLRKGVVGDILGDNKPQEMTVTAVVTDLGHVPQDQEIRIPGPVTMTGPIAATVTMTDPIAATVAAAEDPLADRTEAISNPGPELDKDGIPWDARIHSDAKDRLSKEGYWKRRRNTDDAVWNAVREELKAAMAAPATDVPPPPAAADVPPPPAAADVPPPPAAADVPPPPAAADVPPPPAAADVPPPPAAADVPPPPAAADVPPPPAAADVPPPPAAADVPPPPAAADVPPPPAAADVPPPPAAADVPPPPAPPPAAAAQYMVGTAGPFTREQLIASGYTDEAIDQLPQAGPAAPQDFPSLLAMLAKPVAEGKITSERLDAVAASLGLPSWQTLVQRQDLVPAAFEQIKNEI